MLVQHVSIFNPKNTLQLIMIYTQCLIFLAQNCKTNRSSSTEKYEECTIPPFSSDTIKQVAIPPGWTTVSFFKMFKQLNQAKINFKFMKAPEHILIINGPYEEQLTTKCSNTGERCYEIVGGKLCFNILYNNYNKLNTLPSLCVFFRWNSDAKSRKGQAEWNLRWVYSGGAGTCRVKASW